MLYVVTNQIFRKDLRSPLFSKLNIDQIHEFSFAQSSFPNHRRHQTVNGDVLPPVRIKLQMNVYTSGLSHPS